MYERFKKGRQNTIKMHQNDFEGSNPQYYTTMTYEMNLFTQPKIPGLIAYKIVL